MDDWLLFAPDLEELEKKVVKLMKFCEDKNLKLNPSKMCIGEEVEFGGSIISAEIVKQEDVIFIAPKSPRLFPLKLVQTLALSPVETEQP